MRPTVSVVMANYCGAAHLDAAIRSVRRQTLSGFELIVSDDGSTDDSVAIARRHADEDPRVLVIEADAAKAGPAVARNRALDAARGEWVAIVDSDDLIHPQRLERMHAAAVRLGADIVADDLVFFGEALAACGRTLLQDLNLSAPREVDTRLFLRANGGDPEVPSLGYLKPMIRTATLGSLRYDTSLRIGEDYDLCLRLLMGGARYALIPDPMYLYRRHSGSISHRLSVPVVQAMLDAQERLPPPADAAEARERKVWRARLEEQHRFERLVASLKARRPATAVPLMMRPGMIRRLARSASEHFRRGGPGPERRGATVRLSAQPSAEAQLAVVFPAVPPAGVAWPSPPALAAASLSALTGRYRLRADAGDETGRWATWLIPASHEAC